MNQKELGELRRRLRPDKCAIKCIYGCYVNGNKEIVSYLDESLGRMSEEEAEDNDRPDLNQAELQVAKHRNGPTRDITLSFSAEFTKFGDWVDDSYAGGY